MTSRLEEILPPLNPGWRWEVDLGNISHLILVDPSGWREGEVVSLAPSKFWEPYYNWTHGAEVTDRHLQVTAQRILTNVNERLRKQQEAANRQAYYNS